MINFNNFPQNSKKTLPKMKNPELDQSQEYCLNLLRKSLQYSVNEKINKILNEYKKDYIKPMIENFRKNYGHGISGASHQFLGSFLAVISMFSSAILLGFYVNFSK